MTTRKSLIERHGSSEAVSQYYRELQKKRTGYDGKKAAQTLKDKYGKDYFKQLAKRGGKRGKSKKQ